MGPVSKWTRCFAVAALLADVFVLVGCGAKAPAEANALLDRAAKALAAKDFEGFRGCLLPAQRAGMLELPEWPYFAAVVGHKIDNEFDRNVTDTTAKVMASLYFTADQKEFASLCWSLVKDGGQWFVDLAQTIADEKATNGANAFQSFIIKVTPK
jgi:hypothetical protein